MIDWTDNESPFAKVYTKAIEKQINLTKVTTTKEHYSVLLMR